MAAETCNISFKIDYTSSKPIKSAIAYYKNKNENPSDPYSEYNISPIPSSSDTVKLPFIPDQGEYELIIELMDEDGVAVKEKSLFKIGNCYPVSCETPIIDKLEVLSDGQIRMVYTVTATNLSTPEYQIATDNGFNNIVGSRVGFNYTQTENFDMTNIPNNTVLYVRVRKHCSNQQGTSNWSVIAQITSKTWSVKTAPYTMNPAVCVSSDKESPLEEGICYTGNKWTKQVNLITSTPQIGSQLYLSDGITLATPGNLSSFDIGNLTNFNRYGIRWVRFSSYSNNIYDVDPSTATIQGFSQFFKC
ncbi:hypothetical protein QX233_18895 [Chryseobacterium gambrini]|uniref:Uncharacterized protein n=1 Tax=Chryseobacterium gambrini TaxID=373672 RepID=A0AAJ1R7Q4_9FLAO|nr:MULTISPECIES: hypothetical protein [Chryseobacterium]MDN4014545.1 hypothetical protein [Chryseobacterium gambrini]MDN4028090.1 hypothetical protein [Chryseobacterium gambrini]QWA39805.1 hypothetical protein KKI44_06245 [Chryseobacterium sp. ZHDP1]